MLTTTELIILKGVKYSDTSSIVNTYSEQYGSLAFKISRTPTSRKRGGMGAFFMPLSILSVTFNYQTKREVFIPKEYSIIHTPKSPSIDPTANAVALFTVELLNRLLRSDGGDSGVYNYIKQRIQQLDNLPKQELSSFHLGTIVGILHYIGILPQIESYKPGYILDNSEGQFIQSFNKNDKKVSASKLLIDYIKTPNPEALPINKEERNTLLDLLLQYLTYHYPEIGNLHSPEILTQLF